MSTKLAVGSGVKSPVVIGNRLHIGSAAFQSSPTQEAFECSASERLLVASGGQGSSTSSHTWSNDVVRKANWAVQGSSRRAIRNCEVTSKGSMLNLLFLIMDEQVTSLNGEVVEIARDVDGFGDEGEDEVPGDASEDSGDEKLIPAQDAAGEESTNVTNEK